MVSRTGSGPITSGFQLKNIDLCPIYDMIGSDRSGPFFFNFYIESSFFEFQIKNIGSYLIRHLVGSDFFRGWIVFTKSVARDQVRIATGTVPDLANKMQAAGRGKNGIKNSILIDTAIIISFPAIYTFKI